MKNNSSGTASSKLKQATYRAIFLVVTLSSLGGFALAKYRFRGRKALMAVMLVTMMLPSHVLLSSSWLLMYHMGWLNSYKAIIIPGAVSVFGMFLFMRPKVGTLGALAASTAAITKGINSGTQPAIGWRRRAWGGSIAGAPIARCFANPGRPRLSP